MRHSSLSRWQHDHTFGQDQVRPGERRTLLVVLITGVMMVVEIAAGVLFGSMALLADGLHMASHAVALGIAVFAYRYARRHADDERFSFGTGKVNSLGGFTGAVLLAVFAAMMAWESAGRLVRPVAVLFDQALLVAVVGLVVNGASVLILGHADPHRHEGGPADPSRHGARGSEHDDHNLRAAYLHVLADALTSVLAILALLGGKYLDAVWLDPAMGIVGALLVARWSWGLLRQSGRVLLDFQAPGPACDAIVASLEEDAETRVADLHVWSIAPAGYAAEVTVVTDRPQAPEVYRRRLPACPRLLHVTVQVSGPAGGGSGS